MAIVAFDSKSTNLMEPVPLGQPFSCHDVSQDITQRDFGQGWWEHRNVQRARRIGEASAHAVSFNNHVVSAKATPI